jgi:hypothetical protein
MSTEYPTPAELGVKFTADEDRVARGAINRYGDGGHPMADDKPTLRAADFVAGYVRNCLHTALNDRDDPLTDKGKVLATSAIAKMTAVLPTPAHLIGAGFVVIIRPDGGADYELATRTVFETKDAALHYANTVNHNHLPIVVSGPWGALRLTAEED